MKGEKTIKSTEVEDEKSLGGTIISSVASTNLSCEDASVGSNNSKWWSFMGGKAKKSSLRQPSVSEKLANGESLFEDIIADLVAQKKRVVELNDIIAEHLKLAKARFVDKNSIGAAISMKKVKRHQYELKKVMVVIDYLQTQEIQLGTELEELKELEEMKEKGESLSASVSKLETSDLTRYEKYLEETQNILNANCDVLDNEELLKELTEIIESETSVAHTEFQTVLVQC